MERLNTHNSLASTIQQAKDAVNNTLNALKNQTENSIDTTVIELFNYDELLTLFQNNSINEMLEKLNKFAKENTISELNVQQDNDGKTIITFKHNDKEYRFETEKTQGGNTQANSPSKKIKPQHLADIYRPNNYNTPDININQNYTVDDNIDTKTDDNQNVEIKNDSTVNTIDGTENNPPHIEDKNETVADTADNDNTENTDNSSVSDDNASENVDNGNIADKHKPKNIDNGNIADKHKPKNIDNGNIADKNRLENINVGEVVNNVVDIKQEQQVLNFIKESSQIIISVAQDMIDALEMLTKDVIKAFNTSINANDYTIATDGLNLFKDLLKQLDGFIKTELAAKTTEIDVEYRELLKQADSVENKQQIQGFLDETQAVLTQLRESVENSNIIFNQFSNNIDTLENHCLEIAELNEQIQTLSEYKQETDKLFNELLGLAENVKSNNVYDIYTKYTECNSTDEAQALYFQYTQIVANAKEDYQAMESTLNKLKSFVEKAAEKISNTNNNELNAIFDELTQILNSAEKEYEKIGSIINSYPQITIPTQKPQTPIDDENTKTIKNEDGTTTVLKYDNNRVITSTKYDSNGEIITVSSFIYDENSDRITENIKDKNGKNIEQKVAYTIERGVHVEEERFYDETGTRIKANKIVYDYEDRKETIEHDVYQNAWLTKNIKQEYKNGKVLTYQYEYIDLELTDDGLSLAEKGTYAYKKTCSNGDIYSAARKNDIIIEESSYNKEKNYTNTRSCNAEGKVIQKTGYNHTTKEKVVYTYKTPGNESSYELLAEHANGNWEKYEYKDNKLVSGNGYNAANNIVTTFYYDANGNRVTAKSQLSGSFSKRVLGSDVTITAQNLYNAIINLNSNVKTSDSLVNFLGFTGAECVEMIAGKISLDLLKRADKDNSKNYPPTYKPGEFPEQYKDFLKSYLATECNSQTGCKGYTPEILKGYKFGQNDNISTTIKNYKGKITAGGKTYNSFKEFINAYKDKLNELPNSISFEEGDLYYSLHGVTIAPGSYVDSSGNVHITFADVYDFNGNATGNSGGAVLNRVGAAAMDDGELVPYYMLIDVVA